MFQFEKNKLQSFLNDANYPAGKSDLVTQAEKASLPHQLVLLMQRLEDRNYENAQDVEHTMATHKA